jgi:2-polyprenyl-3-methyl-5-hydroxy-6-metoxy-1,4-benzoquinol methylase
MNDPFKDLYDEIADRKDEASKIGPYHGGNGRIDRAVDLILNEDFPRSGTLIDVGGSTGNLGYALRDYFSDRITLDISEACRVPAESKGNTFICANVDNSGIPMPDERSDGPSADMIVALDFIEHILDPEHFARECFRTLKSGGKVLVNTPNIQFWRHLHSLVVEGNFPHTSGDQEVYHGGHVAFFNFQDMSKIFTAAGFVDMRLHTRGLTPEPPPPIWSSICRVGNIQLSYADLIFSCRKP